MLDKTHVIIVTYNGAKWITKCLDSIKGIDNIIIVDNNSTDNTVEIISKNFPKVTLHKLSQNLGFALANNIGMKEAFNMGAEYFVLLNQDAWCEPDTIDQMISISKEHSDFGILSPMHLNGSGELLDWNFTTYITNPKYGGRKLFTDLLKKEKLEKVYPVNFVNAAFWIINRRCIQKVGLFDHELFPHYGEDSNYIERAKHFGFDVGIVPSSFIFHDREERSGVKTSSQFDIINLTREFTSQGANILILDSISKMDANLNQDRKLIFKNILKFNLAQALNHNRLLKHKKNLRKKILSHKNEYQKEGFNLDIELRR